MFFRPAMKRSPRPFPFRRTHGFSPNEPRKNNPPVRGPDLPFFGAGAPAGEESDGTGNKRED